MKHMKHIKTFEEYSFQNIAENASGKETNFDVEDIIKFVAKEYPDRRFFFKRPEWNTFINHPKVKGKTLQDTAALFIEFLDWLKHRTPVSGNKPLHRQFLDELKESRINESKGGAKVQKFVNLIDLDPDDLAYFIDAEEGDGLHKGWHSAMKKLKLTDDNAVICFADVVSDYDDMMDAAKKAGLKFLEVEESDDDNGGIIFDVNQ